MFGLRYEGRVDGAVSFVVVNPAWRRFWCASQAGATFFGRIVVYRSPMHMLSQRVRKHEITHVEQSRRIGGVKFLMLYRYYHSVHGYRDNPLEEEARRVAQEYESDLGRVLRMKGIPVMHLRR